MIYPDQAFIAGRGEYPEELETLEDHRKGPENLPPAPVKINDEPLLKDFFYSFSDVSIYQRFISARKDIPHKMLQDFVIV